MNPYKRFSITIATSLLVSTVVVTAVASYLIQRFFILDTAHITRGAVETHFRQLFGFDLFAGAHMGEHAGHGQSGYGSSSTGGSSYGSSAGGYGEPEAVDLEALDGVVRFHFDLYDVVYTAFYAPDGTIVYSYRPEEVGTKPMEGPGLIDLARGVSNYELIDMAGQGERILRQYLRLEDGGQLAGLVQVQRDVGPLIKEIRLIQVMVGGVVLAVFAALFFALRRIYLNSTQAISRQSRALSEALDQLNATYDATLQALSAALDSRDSDTEGHALRVVAYTARLSQQLGLDQKEREVVLRGALLHDVGKIGVPDAILRKKGALTDDEWVEMRKHPEIGFNMLRDIPFLTDALPVVLHHHERFDGNGYPSRLKAEEIPFGARIFAVVDTLDAITADRPYRQGRSVREAQEEIRRCSGSQFDPKVVEAFLAVPEQEWQALSEQTKWAREKGSEKDMQARPQPA